MNFPEREARGLAPYWIIRVSVGEVKIVVKQTAFDQEHFAVQRVEVARCLDDRFHDGLDEASIHGTGIMFVDSSFEKS
jgi:hypothetical protein